MLFSIVYYISRFNEIKIITNTVNKHIKNYLVGIFILTLFFIVIGNLFKYTFPSILNFKHVLIQILIFFILNASTHFLLVKILEKSPKRFNHSYLILIMIRILLYLTFLVTFIFILKTGLKSFLISFLILYIGYSIYETIFLSRYVKNNGVK